MKDKTKKELKDWLEILGCMVISSVVVFSVNGRLNQCTRAKKEQDKSVESVEAKADTVAAARDSVIMLGKNRTR